MRKILSVVKLNLDECRRGFLRMMIVTLLLEGGYLAFSVVHHLPTLPYTSELSSVTDMIGYFPVSAIFLLGLLGVMFSDQMGGIGSKRSSRMGYTIYRLDMPLRNIFLGHVLSCLVMNLIYWSMHLLLLFGVSAVYVKLAANTFGAETCRTMLVNAFYESRILHTLLPMRDWIVYPRNLLLILSLACTGGHYWMRRFYDNGQSWSEVVWIYIIVTNIWTEGDRWNILYDCILYGVILLVEIVTYKPKSGTDLYPKNGKKEAADG